MPQPGLGRLAGKRDVRPVKMKTQNNTGGGAPGDDDNDNKYLEVKEAWAAKRTNVIKATRFMASLRLGGWEWDDAAQGKVMAPARMLDVDGVLEKWFVEPPAVSSG